MTRSCLWPRGTLRLAAQSVLPVLALVILAWAGQVAAQSGAAERHKTLLFVDEPLAPLTLGSSGGPAQGGMVPEFLQELSARLGIPMRLELMPFARALKTVEHGQADGMPLLIPTSERRRFMDFTQEVIRGRELFFKIPGEDGRPCRWNGFNDLKGLRIGLIRGYAYGPDFLAAIKEVPLTVEYAVDSEANFRKLAAGRVDVILEDEFTAANLLRDHPNWRALVMPMSPPVSTYSWSLGLSRASGAARLLPEVDKAVGEMKAQGDIERIFRKGNAGD